jgi:hypothetical protein
MISPTPCPDLFTDYIVASPGLVPEIFRCEDAWAAAHDDLGARVTLTAGGRDCRTASADQPPASSRAFMVSSELPR